MPQIASSHDPWYLLQQRTLYSELVTMRASVEVSAPSGIFVMSTPLPNNAMMYTATNENAYPQSFRITWSASINVRAQLHGDSTVQDSLTALWTLEPFRYVFDNFRLLGFTFGFETSLWWARGTSRTFAVVVLELNGSNLELFSLTLVDIWSQDVCCGCAGTGEQFHVGEPALGRAGCLSWWRDRLASQVR